MRVAVNGFGRIGRDVVRQIFERNEADLELVAINFSSDLHTMAHLLNMTHFMESLMEL